MKTITRISRVLPSLLGEGADQAARDTGFIQREVKVTGRNFAQTLVCGFLGNPQMSYRQMSQMGARSGLQITAQGLEQRFSPASVRFLQRLLEQALQQRIEAACGPTLELLQRFSQIHIQDSSVIGVPNPCVEVWAGMGTNGQQSRAAVKLPVELEYLSGRVSGPVLAPGREHDQKSPFFRQSLPRGALRLTDLGFFNLDRLEQDAQAGGFWIIRYKHDVHLYQHQGDLALLPFLRKQGQRQMDLPVQVGKTQHLPCRLIVLPVDEPTAAQRRRRLRDYARKKQQALSAERLELANWTLLLTHAPPELLSVAEVYALLRLRWQIELLFRLWKTYTRIDESESQNPWRILTELYAKLLAVLIQHWLLLASVWPRPEKSLVQASLTIQKFAPLLQLSLQNPPTLRSWLATLVTLLQASPGLLKRRQRPSTVQILRNPQLAVC